VAPFLLFAAVTGVILAATEFFGEDEEAREKARETVSPVTLRSPAEAWSAPMAKAFASAEGRAGGAPVDKAAIDFKSDPPTVTVYTGKPAGGEDRKFIFDARTGEFLREEEYVDKPFLVRLHSGEAVGDGGLVVAMLWGLALVFLVASGVVIYWAMRRPGAKGWRRVFWAIAPMAIVLGRLCGGE
jgi:uncharacterized iron-regulated membrane protein